MGAETEFGLLGSLLVRQGTRLVPVSAGKQRVVLAALLLGAGRVLSVDELAEAVWGDGQGPPASARVTVQNHVRRLRQLLGDSGTSATLREALALCRGFRVRPVAGALSWEGSKAAG